MGGGYVSCGTFTGDDKSCSALHGVLEQIEGLPSFGADAELGRFVARVKAFLTGAGDPEWTDCVLVTPRRGTELEPYLEECKQSLIAELGISDPFVAIERDVSERHLDPTEAKWGKGKGWRLYCVIDLLRAIGHSRATDEDICIAFD